MAFPFNPFTHMHTFKKEKNERKKRPLDSRTFIFLIFVPQNQRIRKSREAALRVQQPGLTEQSEVEAGVVYCFKPSVPNNLCKQGHPIPTPGAIMAVFAEAVAPHCPHQWSWWIDVWVWYLIRPAQLHNRETCLASDATLTQAAHTKITSVFVKRVTWP